MRKKLLSTLLALCMVAALLPTMAMAAEPATEIKGGEINSVESAKTAFSITDDSTHASVSGSDSEIVVTLSGDIALNNVEIMVADSNIKLTIKGNGIIKCTQGGAIGTWNETTTITGSEIILETGVTVEQDSTVAANPVYAYHGGKVTVNGATIKSNNPNVTTMTAGPGSTINIEAGLVTSSASTAVRANGGTINITGGTVQTTSESPAYVAAWANSNGGNNGTVTVSGNGILIGKSDVALCSTGAGTVKVEGGSIIGGTAGAVLAHEGTDAKAIISAGTIKGAVNANDGADVSITGGTFNTDVDETYLDENVAVKTTAGDEGEETYTYSTSLTDALEAAEDGATVEVIKEATVEGNELTVPDGVTLTGVEHLTTDSTTDEADIKINGTVKIGDETYEDITIETSTTDTEDNITIKYNIESGTAADGGAFTVSEAAAADTSVTISVTPADGYEVDEVTVTTETGTVDVSTVNANSQYSFTMPASAVIVAVTFKQTTESTTLEVSTVAVENMPSAVKVTISGEAGKFYTIDLKNSTTYFSVQADADGEASFIVPENTLVGIYETNSELTFDENKAPAGYTGRNYVETITVASN